MLRLNGSYEKMMNSIRSQNIPKEWTWNMDHTICRLLSSMLSKFLKEAKTMIVIENEEEIIEVRDRLNQIIKWEDNADVYDMDKERAKQELERREEFRIETFEKLGKILPSLWW